MTAVVLHKPGGGEVTYSPAQDNDQSRGVALIQAATEAEAGAIQLAPLTRYDIGGTQLDLVKPGGMLSLLGHRSTIRGHINKTYSGNAMVHGGFVQGCDLVAEGYAVCWGAGLNDAPLDGATLRDSTLMSATTGVVIEAGGSRARIYGSTIVAQSMGIYQYAEGVHLDLWDTVLDVDCGPTGASAVGAYFGGVGSETYLYGCRIKAVCASQAAPTYPSARGIYVGAGDEHTEVWLIGSAVETEGPGSIDLYQYGPAKLWSAGSSFDPKKVQAKLYCKKCEGGY